MELPFESSRIRHWVVFEHAHRWSSALQRFAPQLMPDPLTAKIHQFRPTSSLPAPSLVSDHPILVWEVSTESCIAVCDRLIETSIHLPKSLCLAVSDELPESQCLILLELGAAGLIQKPEQLNQLRPMIHAYFAPPADLLN